MKVILITLMAVAMTAATGTAQTQPSSLTEADQLQIAIQKICPVSGEKLGSMGDPIKIKAGDQILYLCCQGCQSKQLDAEHWATILENIAAAQQTCPIMGKPVDASMKSTVVNGQRIFVCCPPCIDKIQANPDAAIQKVHSNYLASVQDQLQFQAQGICPVSGKQLGSMGAPVKVKFGEEEIGFLCCQGCVGKQMKAQHWETIQANLAEAQGTCPVMGDPVDSSSPATVVKGRRVFACCEQCIEKIQAEPTAHVAKLNTQIANGGQALESGNQPDDGNDR